MSFRFLLLFFFVSMVSASGQDVALWNKNTLEKQLKLENDTVYIFNFWATWCKPCIEELPEFKSAQQQWEGKPVRFVFVSLDFMSKRESTLIPFVANSIPWATVVQLDAGNPNDWIPQVAETWSGAIPATLIWSAKGRFFFEESLYAPRINAIIQKLIP